jgi:hypothetical protein
MHGLMSLNTMVHLFYKLDQIPRTDQKSHLPVSSISLSSGIERTAFMLSFVLREQPFTLIEAR